MKVRAERWPGGAPLGAVEAGAAVLGVDDGQLEVLVPQPRAPVARRQEVLGEKGAAHDRVHGAVVAWGAEPELLSASGQQLTVKEADFERTEAETLLAC